MKFKKIRIELSIIAICIICLIFSINSYLSYTPPEPPAPYYIDLSQFQGRIYQASQIKPGTFTLPPDNQQTFDQALAWGTDAILSYYFSGYLYDSHNNYLTIEIWKPDPLTTGTFQYVQKKFINPWTKDGIWFINKTEIQKDQIILYAGINKAPRNDWPYIVIIVICLIVAGIFSSSIATKYLKKT